MNKMNRKQLSDLISRIETIHEELDEIKDGEEEKFDNMPENLQDSEKGEAYLNISSLGLIDDIKEKNTGSTRNTA